MGVPNGSILGPLLLLLYINNLPNCLFNVTPFFKEDMILIKSGTNILNLYRDMNLKLEWVEKKIKVQLHINL